MSKRIDNPAIEILAIMLFEHDHGCWPVGPGVSTPWSKLSEEDRETYREMARGERDLE
jgi:hypothetical protein